MKRILLAGFCLLVASLGFAQNQTLPEQLYQLHAPLDKTQCATGFLFDLAVPMAHPLDYRGVLSEENYTSKPASTDKAPIERHPALQNYNS